MSTANIIGNAIFGLRNKSGGNYIDPAVKESLVGLWKFDQNTNESPTRNIIKNTIKDKGGDLELLNFGYKLNSGYSKYELDFNEFTTNTNINTVLIEKNKDTFYAETLVNSSTFLIYKTIRANNTLTDTPSFKAKVEINKGTTLQYRYINSDGVQSFFNITEEGEHEFPISYNNRYVNSVGVATNGFVLNRKNTCRITQIPSFQGALVTDGKDDMIVSQKTVQEMLGGSNVCTVVSMIHQINLSAGINTSINNIRSESVAHVCARHLNTAYGKTGIFGYSKQLNTTNNPTLINNILGDKKDYIAEGGSVIDTTDKYFVQGYKYNDSLYELSEVAVYWTFIANKVLTTDEINQIIAYFKLDKYVTPQVIYDVKRQGLTNDTPAADWYLKDFSGNGYDMQLYNYAKSKDSGIGKYAEDFTTWNKYNHVVVTKDKITVTDKFNQDWLVYKHSKSSSSGISPMRIKITGIPINARIEYRYAKTSSDTALSSFDILENGVYDIPESFIINNEYSVGFKLSVGDWTHIEITQIPDYEGALVSDGKDDYGHADNLPIFKDYTVVADRAIVDDLPNNADGGVFSKSTTVTDGAFIFDYKDQIFSFGTANDKEVNTNRFISYQSKYINNGKSISAGSMADVNHLLLAKFALESNRYSALALYSMLLFPYSLSEFLLERQLKKYKLGTLYPNMVEWRPIISSNIPYDKIEFFDEQWTKRIYPGDYVEIGATIKANLYLNNYDISTITSLTSSQFESVYIDRKGQYYDVVLSGIKKSPQKIDITIDEYIRYENIVQPYPAIINLKQDGKTITWGDKLKVGSDIVFVGSANLLPELYTVSETRYNGVTLYPNTIIKVEKSMVFDNARTYLKANEPSCILSPNRLRIPNSSYKILGYIPDLTGKGNHGRLNNFAYTEESGANEDGSIRFDGTDDYITIPTLAHGAKQVLMKVNLQSYDRYLYDQRNTWSQYLAIVSAGKTIAYEYSNKGGKTYIDGILNEHIIDKDLLNITHNITAANANIGVQYAPNIGTSFARGNFAQMALFDFMLFPEISSEDEIKELNECVGIEGNVWGTLTQLINSTLISNETLIKNE